MEAFEIADPKFKMPTNNMVTEDIKKLHALKKVETKEEFKKVEYLTQTNDAGTSLNGKSFVDINVHWLTEDFYPKKKILDVLEMEENKNAVNYRNRVDKKEEEFEIKEKVFCYTTDNEPTMNTALKKHERQGCFSHCTHNWAPAIHAQAGLLLRFIRGSNFSDRLYRHYCRTRTRSRDHVKVGSSD